LCHGILDADDRDTDRGRALRATAARAKAELSRLASVPVESEACLVYSKDDARVLREQYLSKGLYVGEAPWMQAGYDLELAKWFAPYVAFNVNADVKTPASIDVERYSAISLPLHQMADPDFVARLEAWVRHGGVLVLGYRAGARDGRNWNVKATLPGLFSELAGVRVPRYESLNRSRTRLSLKGLPGLVPARAEVWADLVEPTTAEPIAWYSGREKHYRGAVAATVNRHGRGKVYYLGTSPDQVAMFFLYRRILKAAGLEPRFCGSKIEVVERRTDEGARVRIALNHSPKSRRVLGRRLPPWGWAVVD
ncbi:MAG: beta-galactosidase trimerization domain-containing protein, partial [Spirochaetaceae bacterium]|nr:beta-galactosidase trimerization domain-containing protein [Spirochaetaceae bacterium]